MDPLRWIILGVGLLLLAGIYLLGRWRERRRREREQADNPLASDASRAAGGGGKVFVDDLESPYDHPPAPNYDTPFIDEDALQGIDDLLKRDELGRGAPGLDPQTAQRAAGAEDSTLHSDTGAGSNEPTLHSEIGSASQDQALSSDTGVGPAGPWWQDDESQYRSHSAEPQQPDRQQSAQAHYAQPQPAQAQPAQTQRKARQEGQEEDRHGERDNENEPVPLKLSPASQVEMEAYRSANVPQAEKVVVVYVGAHEGQRFEGEQIAAALEAVRMVPGEHRIWHRRGRSELGRFTLFSVASMVEPGYLDPQQTLPRLQTPGLAFFLQLPLPVDSEEALDAMLASAYHVSRHLDGLLLDSTRSTLTRQVAEHLREQLREHRRQLHIAMHKK